jgi:hypothetical protein
MVLNKSPNNPEYDEEKVKSFNKIKVIVNSSKFDNLNFHNAVVFRRGKEKNNVN